MFSASTPQGAGNFKAIAVAHFNSPYITAYPWSGSGFGTKYADPVTLPTGDSYGVAFSSNGSTIAVAHGNAPYITAYPWSVSGFGTKYTDPVSYPTGTGRGVAFSPNGSAIALAHANAPYITVYPWSPPLGLNYSFGTKYVDFSPALVKEARGVAFSPDGSAIAVVT